MEPRLPINSQSLKERFPEVYRDFFSKCALVCSAPRSVTWIGEHIVRIGGLTMRQAIPIRTYVGVTPTATHQIKISSHITYDPFLNQFHEDTLPQEEYHNPIERQLLKFLKKELRSYEWNSGFDIHILTELPFERAIGAAGSLLVPLFCALLLQKRILSANHIQLWSAHTVADLQKNKEAKFDEVFRLIWKWEGVIYMTPSAANPFSALLPSSTPLIFASKRPPEQLSELPKGDNRMDNLDWVDQSHYWGARTSEVFGQHVGYPFPFDWGILSSSGAWTLRDSVFSIAELQKELQRTARSMKKVCDSFFENLAQENLPDFLRVCLPEDKLQVWQEYVGPLHLLSFQAFLRFRQIIEQGFSRAEVEELFGIINKMHSMLSLLNFSSPVFEKMAYLLRELISERASDAKIGVKLNSTSRRGNLLFAMQAAVARSWLPEIIEDLRARIDQKISLDYASWIDGYEEEGGVKIEQWTEQGIYSPLLAVDSLRLTRRSPRGKVETRIVASASAASKKGDILLDLPHGKLYVAGKECTSKEIPSQKATVAIMDALLSAEGHRLHNRALPESGYTKYRNEFQGKITGPLVALAKKRLKKELPLKVEGTLTDFWVSLDPKGFEIGVVSPVVRKP